MELPPAPSLDALLAHQGLVRSLARSLLREPADAEDLGQDTWVAALTRPPRHGGSASGWLARVTRNLAASAHRRRAARVRHEPRAARPGSVGAVDDIVAREEVRRRVLATLLALEPLHRDPLLLRFYDGLPPRKVARALGVPVETARTRIRRGLEQMRIRLDAHHESEAPGWRVALAAWSGGAVLGGTKAWALAALLVVGAGGGAAYVLADGDFGRSRSEASLGAALSATEANDPTGRGDQPVLVGRGGAPRPVGVEQPAEEGASVPDPADPARADLRGTLRAADGTTPSGGFVDAFPSLSPDVGRSPGIPVTHADPESGAWTLTLREAPRWTLRAGAPGFRTVTVDLARARPGEPIALQLEPGRQVHVRLREADGARPRGNHFVRLGSLVDRPTRTANRHDDSAVRRDLWRGIDVDNDPDAAGDLTVGLGDLPEPVFLEYCADRNTGRYAVPDRVLLTPGVESVEFRLHPTCRVVLRVRPREGARVVPYPTPYRATLVDESTGRPFDARFAGSLPSEGVAELTSSAPLPPGRYTLHYDAEGYLPWTRERIELARAGSSVELDIDLEPDPACGLLTVLSEKPDWVCVAARPTGQTGAWRVGLGQIQVLRAGSYDLIVWHMRERGAGLERGVRLLGQESTVRTVRTGPGLEVPLRPEVPEGAAIRRVALRSSEFGELPLVALEGGQSGGQVKDFTSGRPPTRGARLGPYPVDDVTVTVETWEGTTYTWTVRR